MRLAPLFALPVLLVSGVAHAALYSVDVCAKYQVDYNDAEAAVGDDYFTNNADKVARGARVKIIRNADGVVMFDGFTPYTGSSAGCTGNVTLSSSQSYEVRLYSEAEVHGNTIEVLNDSTNNQVWYSVMDSGFSPTSSGTVTMSSAAVHRAWNIAAAAGHAMWRRNGGLNGETITIFSEGCNGTGGNCNSGLDVFIKNDNRKFVVVHELGHQIAKRRDEYTNPAKDYNAPQNACYNYTRDVSGHPYISKEYQSAAAVEGFASYYAAVAFNKTNESDCGYKLHYDLDWDLDQVKNDSRYFSCEGGIDLNGDGDWTDPGDVDAKDFLGDYCLGTGISNNRGTQYDWLRFFWDLDTDEGLNTTQILDIWDEADPKNWNATGNGTGPNYPATRLRDAASALGYLTEWDNQDNSNGVHR